jgi:uncharacterized protein YutE (UPF0331/DUF86 family)
MAALARNPATILSALSLASVAGATLHLRNHLIHNHEESEARLDEIEGTLRGHIGLIENSLERIEKKIGSEKIKNNGGIKSS